MAVPLLQYVFLTTPSGTHLGKPLTSTSLIPIGYTIIKSPVPPVFYRGKILMILTNTQMQAPKRA